MRRVLVLAVLGATLVASAQASAATYTVLAGENSRKGAPEPATQNRFMPASVSVHAGDRVAWKAPIGFHTVSFIGARNPATMSFFHPDTGGALYSGLNDAAGNPFYFNGMAKWVYDLTPFAPTGGKVVADRNVHSTLVGKDAGAPTVTFRFPKPGTYTYVCLLHPGMKGKVVVKPAAARVPPPAAVEAKGTLQVKQGWARAKALLASEIPPATILAGVEEGGVTLFALAPETLTVKAGTPVTVIGDAVTEAHNVTTGPEDWLKQFLASTDIFPDRPGDPSQIMPFAFYGSDPGALVHDGSNHGNGVLSTAALDSTAMTPLARTATITFTKPGTYTIFCTLHFPDMKAQVVVTE